ncbi:MAG: hypothetical protein R3C05_08285 [Pirellulaceae bacterium]
MNVSHDDFISVISNNSMDRVVYLPKVENGNLLQQRRIRASVVRTTSWRTLATWAGNRWCPSALTLPPPPTKSPNRMAGVGLNFDSGRSTSDYFQSMLG